ncbi:glycosyltransferase family 8 protein [Dyadobacter arcticus]|uniref:Lipopolysaccharide biosynthesis glycosyltransferase n=1 Tax=Dyadobacter arcticus TaxID=1078754 RepID=A0ABX0UMI0_9BACT|nr:glycosyltransferase family 8 protein [Dyadobacter arcticus]NIJ53653.1 lipopolysaccharide biosynthesis glycosyltransferase [Dyadobacter arcticus]
MSIKDKITIIVATDNHYVILLGALIKSIEVNHKTPEKIDLYIIDDGVSESNKKKVQASSNPEMTTMYWCKSQEVIPPNVKIPVDKSAFPITSYLRLFGPYIIPQDTERFLYLDVDMIVVEEISKLWHTDLEDKLFGAVADLAKVVSSEWGGVPNYKELGFDPQTPYFNAGLLLVDPIKWREGDFSTKILKCIFDNLSWASFPDQYGLNVVLVNQWVILDERWNSYAILDVKDPYIIHYLDIKPIFKSYNCNLAYKEEFYKYLRMTPWKDHQPVPDWVRLSRKAYNKLRKIVSGYLK